MPQFVIRLILPYHERLTLYSSANTPPSISINEDETIDVTVGQEYEIELDINDIDESDVLTTTMTGYPAGATFDSTSKLFKWTPSDRNNLLDLA